MREEDTAALSELGLTVVEQSLYESLMVGLGDVPAEVVGTAAFTRLAELGLVTQLAGDPPQWTVAEPDTAFAPLLARRRQSLRELRQQVSRLADRFQRAEAPDHARLVEVVRGRDAVQAAFAALVREAREEVLCCDAPPYVTELEFSPAQRDALKRGVRMRTLYDREGVAIPGRLSYLAALVGAGEQARVIDVPMKLLLCDRRAALVPLHASPVEAVSYLLVRGSVLLAALVALFESFWQRAVPLEFGAGHAALSDGADLPSERERQLLLLLAAGLTDSAIAEHLGCTVRTVARHVRRLFARLDATTRFQAGYQAVQRGWLTADDGGVA